MHVTLTAYTAYDCPPRFTCSSPPMTALLCFVRPSSIVRPCSDLSQQALVRPCCPLAFVWPKLGSYVHSAVAAGLALIQYVLFLLSVASLAFLPLLHLSSLISRGCCLLHSCISCLLCRLLPAFSTSSPVSRLLYMHVFYHSHLTRHPHPIQPGPMDHAVHRHILYDPAKLCGIATTVRQSPRDP